MLFLMETITPANAGNNNHRRERSVIPAKAGIHHALHKEVNEITYTAPRHTTAHHGTTHHGTNRHCMTMKKNPVRTLLIAIGMAALLFLPARSGLTRWMMSVPATAFDNTPIPAPPDYSDARYWAALPDRKDSADWLPHGSDYSDNQASAAVDVFFVYPTAAFYGDGWVAGFDNWLHLAAVDFGILPQHSSAFNGIGKIYAPRYRSVRMPIWSAQDKDSVAKATNLAYQDVKNAFDYYLAHWNPVVDGKRRPFILVSHSQGTLHTIRLIRELIDGKALADRFIAGYLIGNTIPDTPWFQHIPLCQSAEQTGCYVTWNTMLEGGDPSHWISDKGLTKIDCVNPLSWKADTQPVDKSANHGSIPMMDYNALFNRLPAMDTQVVGARCGAEGMLWIDQKPAVRGYTAALFPGGSYHTYDINFYYDSIRQNAQTRTNAFMHTQNKL